MNITAFRSLSALSKLLPALIALGVNAILFWGAVRATSVLPPERVSRMPAAAVVLRDRSGRCDLTKGGEDENCRAHASAFRLSGADPVEQTAEASPHREAFFGVLRAISANKE